jgi:hypothetical protein
MLTAKFGGSDFRRKDFCSTHSESNWNEPPAHTCWILSDTFGFRSARSVRVFTRWEFSRRPVLLTRAPDF